MNCSVDFLSIASRCYCIPPIGQDAVEIYLLCIIAGGEPTGWVFGNPNTAMILGDPSGVMFGSP